MTLARQRGDDYNLLLTRFANERLVARFATSPHAARFLPKGALLFALWYDAPHRPTRDADFVGFRPEMAAEIKRARRNRIFREAGSPASRVLLLPSRAWWR